MAIPSDQERVIPMRRLLLGVLLAVSAAACSDANSSPIDPTPPPPPVSPTVIALVMSPGELPTGGGTARVYIETRGGSQPAPNVRVTLSASGGALSGQEVVTDSTGHADVTWTGTQSATLTAAGAGLSSTLTLRVTPPVVLPPLPPPPTPAPTPTPTPDPTPLPTPPVGLIVTLRPASQTVATGVLQAYIASESNLQGNEQVIGYQWEFETGATATTAGNARNYAYSTHGVKNPKVTILTNLGRTATGTGTVVITGSLR
jgi:hypothetical protein